MCDRDVAARPLCSPGRPQLSRERGAAGKVVEPEQRFPLSGGSLCTPRPHASSYGTAGGTSFAPANACTSHFYPHGGGVSGGERDRQKEGALAPLCCDSSTPCSFVAPSPVRSSVLPPRISCPTPAAPPFLRARRGGGSAFCGR